MILWILLGVMGTAFTVALILYLRGKNANSTDYSTVSMGDGMSVSIKEAEPGDFLSISGISNLSKDYKDIVFEIKRKNRYESDGYQWFELMGKIGKKTYWIEWEDDDELEVSGTQMDKPLKITDIGVTEEDLARMDEEESDENFITYKNKKYNYEESGESTYFKDSKGEGESFYSWEFWSEDEEEIISVEKWEGEPHEVMLSHVIDPDHVTVSKK